MEGVLKEGSDLLKEVSDQGKDAAIISSAQRVEHYEIAGYGTARNYAKLLGFDEAGGMLEETLEEEKQADDTLSELAQEVNVEALDAGTEADPEQAESKPSARTRKSGRK
jgi:ferritin-like metal-binding protein YciE